MDFLSAAIAALAAYLIGSLSFAVIVSRAMGLDDPRRYGSGNPGATNVLRSGNKAAAVVTLLLDGVKGYLPVLIANLLAPRFGWGEGTVALVGLAALLGHLWPLFFGFKGGKGVATAGGVLLGFDPWLGLATIATWLLIAGFFRYSSLAALIAAVFAPFYRLLISGGGPVAATVTVLGLLLIWRHRSNIQKLLAGTEPRLGQRAIAMPVPNRPAGRQAPSRHGARR